MISRTLSHICVPSPALPVRNTSAQNAAVIVYVLNVSVVLQLKLTCNGLFPITEQHIKHIQYPRYIMLTLNTLPLNLLVLLFLKATFP